MGIKINQYTETKYDHVKCKAKYVTDQDYLLSVLMANYETDHSSNMSAATSYKLHVVCVPASGLRSIDL